MQHRSIVSAGALAALLATGTAAADPSRLSEAAQLSGDGAAQVAAGSLAPVTASADYTVLALTAVGDGLQVALKGSAQAGEVVLAVPLAIAGGASLAVGETVTVLAQGAGWIISAGGRVIGFVPRQAGAGLLHSRPVTRLAGQ